MRNYLHKVQTRGVVMRERRGYTAAVANPVATRLSQEVAGWREILEWLVGQPSPLQYSNCNPWGRCINRFRADTWPELNWLFGWLCTGKQGTSTFYSGSYLLICFPSMLLTVLYQDQALGCRVQSKIGTWHMSSARARRYLRWLDVLQRWPNRTRVWCYSELRPSTKWRGGCRCFHSRRCVETVGASLVLATYENPMISSHFDHCISACKSEYVSRQRSQTAIAWG